LEDFAKDTLQIRRNSEKEKEKRKRNFSETCKHPCVGPDHGPVALIESNGIHQIVSNVAGKVGNLKKGGLRNEGFFAMRNSGTNNDFGHPVDKLSVLNVSVLGQGRVEKISDLLALKEGPQLK